MFVFDAATVFDKIFLKFSVLIQQLNFDRKVCYGQLFIKFPHNSRF
jgi:hypothetical protein